MLPPTVFCDSTGRSTGDEADVAEDAHRVRRCGGHAHAHGGSDGTGSRATRQIYLVCLVALVASFIARHAKFSEERILALVASVYNEYASEAPCGCRSKLSAVAVRRRRAEATVFAGVRGREEEEEEEEGRAPAPTERTGLLGDRVVALACSAHGDLEGARLGHVFHIDGSSAIDLGGSLTGSALVQSLERESLYEYIEDIPLD